MGNVSPADKVTIVTYPDEFSKREIAELARAAGYSVQALVTQKRVLKSEYGVGVGKAQELQQIVADNGSNTLIIDESLTSSQAYRLSTVTHAEIVDRERLILNIFARRARTTEAKLQVELAELHYEMPRARDAVRYSVQGERAGFSGLGETAMDVKFRALKRRMATIKEKLENSRTTKRLHTAERQKLGLPFVSLAGYTSSGKTTLFNRLALESKEESPNLFTTLTTTTRVVSLSDAKKKVLLSDTVGFISRLPTYLVESFKSTLDELRYADLVLLMVDVSESADSARVKLSSCLDVLNQLDVDPRRVLLVVNKIDLLTEARHERIEEDSQFRNFQAVRVSAVRGDGLHKLRSRVLELISAPKARP